MRWASGYVVIIFDLPRCLAPGGMGCFYFKISRMMKQLAMLALCAVLVAGCGKQEEVEAPAAIKESDISIASLKASKVIVYRFSQRGDEDPKVLIEPASMITGEGSLDLQSLKTLKRAEATLTPEQVGRLVDAVYGSNEKTESAACYEPHHIFLFYDNSDALINVVEVCFECTNLSAYPELEKPQWWRHDFRALARICDEAGVGMTAGSAEDLIQLRDERAKP